MVRDQIEGHVFISYVREDSERVDRLEKLLINAGIPVWRDLTQLRPGQDWRMEIERAINNGALTFIACFSEASERREATYQREELILAAEQVRRRAPGKPWFIPVRFNECNLPYYDLGAGRNLNSYNRVDLFDDDWSMAGALVIAIADALGSTPTPATVDSIEPNIVSKLSPILLEPTREIEVESLVLEVVDAARSKFADKDLFPTTFESSRGGLAEQKLFIGQVDKYVAYLEPLIDVMIYGAAYGKQWQRTLWKQAVERLEATAISELSGSSDLVHLRRLPVCLAVHAGSVGAIYRDNWSNFKSIVLDARSKEYYGGPYPMLIQAHPWGPFEGNGAAANLIAETYDRRAKGLPAPDKAQNKRYTPASDVIALILQPRFEKLFRADESEFQEAFDTSEVMLSLEAQYQSVKVDGKASHLTPWVGRFSWRDRYTQTGRRHDAVVAQLRESGNSWEPLVNGLLGGTSSTAEPAATSFLDYIANATRNRW